MHTADLTEVGGRLHSVATGLTRYDWRFDERDLPPNGLYVMFERGEEKRSPGLVVPRIVRVGSHRKAGRLADRVRANFGAPYSGSHTQQPPLRAHYRRALLRSLGRDPEEPHGADRRFEERVTAEIRERFTFAVIPVEDADERFEMERGLIALLAQYPLCRPSKAWIGHFGDPAVAASGLWNVKHLGARSLDAGQCARLEAYAGGVSTEVETAAEDSGEAPGAASAPAPGPERPLDADENRRIAESLFLGGLSWLRATYADHDFVTRRDIVWMLHKRLATVARRTLSGFEVHSAVRDPRHRSRALDLVITDADGTMLLAANLLYEPDRRRLDGDLRYAMLPYTSWDEMRHECARAQELVASGTADTACTVLVDEDGRYSAKRLPGALREEWHAAPFPSLTVTYAAERIR